MDGIPEQLSKTQAKSANAVWIAVQRLMIDHGRGGEWYKHVEFNVKAISEMTELSKSCVRKYLDHFVDRGNLARYEISGKAFMYMYEVYNAE